MTVAIMSGSAGSVPFARACADGAICVSALVSWRLMRRSSRLISAAEESSPLVGQRIIEARDYGGWRVLNRRCVPGGVARVFALIANLERMRSRLGCYEVRKEVVA